MTKEERKAYKKAYYEAHKEEHKAYMKAYRQAHKEEAKAYIKEHKEERKAYIKAYYQSHKEQCNEYLKKYEKDDLNALGQTKAIIRNKSLYILKKSGIKIPGYENHHCFGYDDPSKFIYCSKEMHLKIHQFLRDNNIAAASDHYEQIKHLLDKNVVVFGI